MNFKIGEKIVCIKQHSKNILTVNKIYNVIDVRYCVRCGTQKVDIGILLNPDKNHTRCRCSERITSPVWWLASYLFVPLEYQTCHDELLETVEEKLDVPEKILS